jgi:hypothetical protein
MADIPWRGNEFSARANEALAEGLNNAGEYFVGRMVPRMPVDTGFMRATTDVVHATPSDLEAVVTVDTEYAVAQHERLDYRHAEGEAKYAERTMRDEEATLLKVIAAPLGKIT